MTGEQIFIGEPVEEVPQREPGDHSNARKSSGGVFEGYCGATAGKGADSVGGGAVLTTVARRTALRRTTRTPSRTGRTPTVTRTTRRSSTTGCASSSTTSSRTTSSSTASCTQSVLGIEAKLFRISVTHAKDIGLDRWADEKPDEQDSGHSLVDKETTKKSVTNEYGESTIIEQRRYRESVVTKAQKKLLTDRRQWLKDLGLLEDPQSQTADAISELKDAWKASVEGET